MTLSKSERATRPDTSVRPITSCDPTAKIETYRDLLKHHWIETDTWIDCDGKYHMEFTIPERYPNRNRFVQDINVTVETTLPSCDGCGVYVTQDGMTCLCTRCYQRFLVCKDCLEKNVRELCECSTARDD